MEVVHAVWRKMGVARSVEESGEGSGCLQEDATLVAVC